MAHHHYYTSNGYEAGYEEGYYQGRYTRNRFILITLLENICKLALSLLKFAVTGLWVILNASIGLMKFLLRARK